MYNCIYEAVIATGTCVKEDMYFSQCVMLFCTCIIQGSAGFAQSIILFSNALMHDAMIS